MKCQRGGSSGTGSLSRAGRIVLRAAAAVMLLAPALPGQRRIVDAELPQSRLWQIGEGRDDTAIVAPNRITLIDGQLVLTDPQGPAVFAVDPGSGKTLWRYAHKGRGPGEMLQPVIAAWHPRGILVADNRTARLYLLSHQGKLLSEEGVPHGLFVSSMCSEADGAVVLNYATMSGTSLLTTRVGSRTATDIPFPFPPITGDLNPSLGYAIDLVSVSGGGCFGARKAAPGMLWIGPRDSVHTGSYVERLHQRATRPPAQMRDTSDLPIPFSLDVGSFDGVVYVWFGGTTCANRCIDFYDPKTLRYLETVRISGHTGIAIYDLTVENDRLYVAGASEHGPAIAAYRFPMVSIR